MSNDYYQVHGFGIDLSGREIADKEILDYLDYWSGENQHMLCNILAAFDSDALLEAHRQALHAGDGTPLYAIDSYCFDNDLSWPDSGSNDCGAGAIVAAIITETSGIPIGYYYGENRDALLYVPWYPWEMGEKEAALGPNDLNVLFKKHMDILFGPGHNLSAEYLDVDYYN